MGELPIEPLSDAEAEAAFVALIEILDGLGCAPAATVASKDGEGVSLSLHFSAERARKLSRSPIPQASEPTDAVIQRLNSAAMDNVDAWRLGEAFSATARDTAGDYIDRGLSLRRHLAEKGFYLTRAMQAAQPTGANSAVEDAYNLQPIAWRYEYRDIYQGHDTGWHHRFSETEPTPLVVGRMNAGTGFRNIVPLYGPEALARIEALEAALTYAAETTNDKHTARQCAAALRARALSSGGKANG